jgi:hypothetical protein
MRLGCALCAACLALGCSSADAAVENSGAGGAGDAACDEQGQPLVPELTLQGAQDVEVQLLSLEPPEPVVGDNTWLVSVIRAGMPFEGATLTVLPWMPEHQHASTKTVLVDETDPGTYRLAPVYLGMVGYWQIGIDIAADDEPIAEVSFDTCLNRE